MPSEPDDVIDKESFVWHSRGTAHWAARGRWGITVWSGEVVSELRSTVELTVTSDAGAIDGVYGATDAFISDADCTETGCPRTTGGVVPVWTLTIKAPGATTTVASPA